MNTFVNFLFSFIGEKIKKRVFFVLFLFCFVLLLFFFFSSAILNDASADEIQWRRFLVQPQAIRGKSPFNKG